MVWSEFTYDDDFEGLVLYILHESEHVQKKKKW